MPTIQKAQKKNKWAIWVALILISALCWIENAYFTEANNVEEARRKVLHIIFLIAIMLLGYWAWYKQPVKWPGKIWLMVYLLVIAVILFIGGINAVFHVFSLHFLDVVRTFRIFFCSPVPFLALLVLSRIGNMKPVAS